MPTGYTAKLHDGPQTFEEFILGCARAFGALVTMRDDPQDSEIPEEIKPSLYHFEAVARAKAALSEVATLSRSAILSRIEKEFEAREAEWHKSIRESDARNKRYRKMLMSVVEWTPPTEEHVGLKKFMIEQIEISMDGGNYVPDFPKRLSIEEWKAREVASAKRDIKYHSAEWEKEVERSSQRTAWVKALRASIEAKG